MLTVADLGVESQTRQSGEHEIFNLIPSHTRRIVSSPVPPNILEALVTCRFRHIEGEPSRSTPGQM